jgi:hypothetical protein
MPPVAATSTDLAGPDRILFVEPRRRLGCFVAAGEVHGFGNGAETNTRIAPRQAASADGLRSAGARPAPIRSMKLQP